MKSPILITGCARSGTSLIAGIINLCGAYLGETCGPTQFNLKGQFENNEIRGQVIKRYLREIGADPMGQLPLPESQDILPGFDLKAEVLNIFKPKAVKEKPWAIKGAKICIMWKAWNRVFPRAKWVIVRRDKEDIIASCMRTRFMHKRKTEGAWSEWVNYHMERFEEIKNNCENVIEIFPDSMMKNSWGGS